MGYGRSTMDEQIEIIDFGLKEADFFAMGLKGALLDFSSEALHAHPFHQVLQIRNGVALLQDGGGKRPQYGSMAAFIPAYVPHRTEVIGEKVTYQSIYFNKDLLERENRLNRRLPDERTGRLPPRLPEQ